MIIIGRVDLMKNKQSGQALIEFVIILPVIILLIFSFIDLGRIVLENNRLENLTTIVIDKYKETNDYEETKKYINSLENNINLDISISDNLLTISLSKDIDLVTPGLNNILDNPYIVKSERVVNYE